MNGNASTTSNSNGVVDSSKKTRKKGGAHIQSQLHDYGHDREPIRPLKVLIVTPVYPPAISVGGGVAITYGALYDKLVQRGHQVEVISPRLGNCDHGITNLYMGHPVFMPTIDNFKLFADRVEASDVVVCPDFTLLPFLIFIAHWKSTPLLSNVHTNFRVILEGGSFAARYLAAPIMDRSAALCSRLAPLTYTTSPSYKEVLDSRGYRVNGVFSPRIKLTVFENGNDTEEEIAEARRWLTKTRPCDTLLIFVGRWSHEKRIHLLVKALPRTCGLAIVGDGPPSFAKKIEALDAPDSNVFVHRGMQNQTRLRILYKASDFMVSASAFETLGMTVAESHLCGTPVIVQAAPGFTTQVVPGQNGYLIDFSKEDAREQLEECIFSKPALTREQIRTTVEKRWDGSLPNLEHVIEDLAEKTKRSDWEGCLGSRIPLWLFWVFIVCHYFVYKLLSFPFIILKGYNHRRRVNPAPQDRDKKMT